MLESILLSFVALPFALMLSERFRPFVSDLFGKELLSNYIQNWPFVLGFISITLVVSIISGGYISFYLSALKPVNILKSNLNSGSSKSFFRKTLIVTQLLIFLVLLICTIFINKQVHFAYNKNLGFKKDNLINITYPKNVELKYYDIFINELKSSPNIINISGAKQGVFSSWGGSHHVNSINGTSIDSHVQSFSIDIDYIETLGFRIIQGRSFLSNFYSDSSAVILNETAVEELGIKNPIGKIINFDRIGDRIVIGVVEDFNIASLHDKIPPLIIHLQKKRLLPYQIMARINSKNIQSTVNFIEEKWKKLVSDKPLIYSFVDQQFDNMYKAEMNLGKTINIFTLLAVFISSLGLFGLSHFISQHKTKEIGIRKVHGASVSNITAMIIKEFIILIILANLVAWPVAWLIMNKWLQNFAYKTSLSLWIFIAAGLLSMIIVMLTLSFNSIKAAQTNPAKVLRYE